MKKYIFLTSVLVLVACSGGHHGGGVNEQGGIVAPVEYEDTVGKSNAEITSMRSNSRYQVARYVANKLGEDADLINLSRAAFKPSVSTGDKDFDKAQELIDLAGWLVNDGTTKKDIVSMFNNSNDNKNKIKFALKLMDDMYCFVGGSAEKTAERILARRIDLIKAFEDLQQKTEVLDLENASFKTASMLLNTGVDDSAIITFETEKDGRIRKITMSLEGVTSEDEEIDMEIDATRRGDTNVFADGTLSFKVDGEEQNVDNNDDFGLLYESGGKKYKTGLRYADFGVIQWGDTSNYDTSNYFAGGYDAKRTDTDVNGDVNYAKMNQLAQSAVNEKLTFTGVADGTVRIGGMSDDSDILYSNNNKLDLSTVATLEFSNGTSVLKANFDKWYDVTATMDDTGKLSDLRFANGNKQGFYHSDDYDFKWQRDGNHLDSHIAETTRDIDLSDPEHPDRTETVVRDGFVQYYGDNGNPSEAVGVVKYGDSLHESGAMRFDMGFGVKRN